MIERALVAYEALLAKGEEIEDEWSYVNDLATAWRDRLGARWPRRGMEPGGSRRAGGRGHPAPARRSRSSPDPHRAIDWLSDVPAGGARGAGGEAVRFQDAAKDARAVVYAGIQADPLAGACRGAPGGRDGGPAGVGACGDERRDDRS